MYAIQWLWYRSCCRHTNIKIRKIQESLRKMIVVYLCLAHVAESVCAITYDSPSKKYLETVKTLNNLAFTFLRCFEVWRKYREKQSLRKGKKLSFLKIYSLFHPPVLQHIHLHTEYCRHILFNNTTTKMASA